MPEQGPSRGHVVDAMKEMMKPLTVLMKLEPEVEAAV
jgi:hypothetical protein